MGRSFRSSTPRTEDDGALLEDGESTGVNEDLSNGIWILVDNFDDDLADDVKHVRRICSKTDGAVIGNCPPPPRSFAPGESPPNSNTIGSGGGRVVGYEPNMNAAMTLCLIWTLVVQFVIW